MVTAIQALQASVTCITPMSDAAWHATKGLMVVRKLASGTHLLHAGDMATQLYFVCSGLLREYYLDARGREFTRHFSVAGEFSGSLVDLLSNAPAVVSIEVLADSVVLEANWAALDALSEQHLSMMKLMRRVAERLYVRKTRREFEMLTLSASERYRRFVKEHPGLDAQLPRHLVASYLGITPVHLSRITAAKDRLHRSRPE